MLKIKQTKEKQSINRGDFDKLMADMKYLTALLRKWGFKKTEAGDAGFWLGDALDDMRKLVEGIDKKNLSSEDLYGIVAHISYPVDAAYGALFKDVSGWTYDFIEEGNLGEFIKSLKDGSLKMKSHKKLGVLKKLHP